MRALAIVKYVFAVFGLAMLLGAFAWYRSTSGFLEEAITAEGTVIQLVPVRSDGSTTYRPVVKFTTGTGQAIEVSSRSSSNPPGYAVGETVLVYYQAGAPQDAMIGGFFSLWGGAVILAVIGGLFSAIAGGLFLVTLLRGRRDQRLRATGRRIATEFQAVELDRSLGVNGRHPFRIVTHWLNPVTSELHVFRSGALWFDPTSFVKGQRITVFIDATHPSTYSMDVSFLPRLAK